MWVFTRLTGVIVAWYIQVSDQEHTSNEYSVVCQICPNKIIVF